MATTFSLLKIKYYMTLTLNMGLGMARKFEMINNRKFSFVWFEHSTDWTFSNVSIIQMAKNFLMILD